MALATLDNVKALLGFGGTGEDALLTLLLDRASAIAAQSCGVETLERSVDAVFYPWAPRSTRAGAQALPLERGPIESATEVRQRWVLSTAWADASTLTEGEDYEIVPDQALLLRINNRWYARQRRLIRVTATVGYADPAAPMQPESDAILPPLDLQHGVEEMTQWLYRRKDLVGTDGINLGQGGAINLRDIEVVESLKHALAALPWRRVF